MFATTVPSEIVQLFGVPQPAPCRLASRAVLFTAIPSE